METKKLIEELEKELKFAKKEFKKTKKAYEDDQTFLNIESAYDLFECWYLRGLEVALSLLENNQ